MKVLKKIAFNGLLGALSVSVIACGKGGGGATSETISSHDPLMSNEHIEENFDRSVRVVKYSMPKDEINRERARYLESDLRQVPTDSRYNTMLFKMDNVKEYANTLFVAPKVYVYGGEDKARLSPKKNGDGTVTLDFPIIITDGLNKEILSPDGKSTIQLPESMIVRNVGELRSEIADRFNAKQLLAPLPGCPKRIYIKFADKEYDALPAVFKRGDYCQMNNPFTASITLPNRDAKFLLEEAIYNGSAAMISVEFETKARIAVSKIDIEFNKNKIFKELELGLSVKRGITDVEVKTHLEKIMKAQTMSMSIVGEINEHMGYIVARASEVFFERFTANPDNGSSPCQKSVCFRLNYNSLEESQTFKVDWVHSKNELLGQNYISWGNLVPLDDSVRIGGSGKMALVSKTSIETGLTVREGDLLEITPESLNVERRSEVRPATIRNDNNTCIKTERRCEDIGERHPKLVCQTICVATQNQWTQKTTYGLSSPTFDQINNPIGQMKEIFEGLTLKFTSRNINGNFTEVFCSLSHFERAGNGKSLLVRIKNSPDCKIFEKGQTTPMLHLYNDIKFPVKYLDGSLVENYRGEKVSTPVEKIFYPEVQFGGNLRIRGYNVGTVNALASQTN